jgi:uncharacterized repeat protein (TIGR01451 family)
VGVTVQSPLSVVETQLTTAGSDQRPAWSPLGDSIVFDSNRSGNRDLWVIPAAGGAATQLTTSLFVDFHSDWSPSGTMIVFSAATAAGANEDLWMLPAGGGAPTLFLSDPTFTDRFPSWSPDSTRIAYAKGDGDVWIAPVAGGAPVRLTTDPGTDTHPTWSPDGTQVAFLSNRSGNNDVWVMPAAGGTPVQVTFDPANDGAPDWSPDGTTIAFQSNRNAVNNNIWIIPAAGGTAQQVTGAAAGDAQPDWAPNGHQISFARGGNLWIASMPGVDVTLAMTADESRPNENGPVTYTLVVTNDGPDPATNVRVTDLLPAGVSFQSERTSKGSYNPGNGLWTVGPLAVGESDTLEVLATLDSGTAGSVIVNVASVSGVDQADGNPFNDSASVTVDVPAADVRTAKTVNLPVPNEGNNVVFTVTVTNDGPDEATSVTVADPLPAGLSWVSDSATLGAYDEGTGTWSVGTLGASASAVMTLTAKVDPGTAGQTLTNVATANADQGDPGVLNDSASASVTVQAADLALTKSVDDPAPVPGGTVEYTVTLTNNGPNTAIGVQISDPLPAGVTFVSASTTQGTYDAGTGLWTVGNMVAATSDDLVITATVDPGTLGQTIVNTAVVSAVTQGDPVSGNDSASAQIDVTLAATETQLTVSATDQRPAWAPDGSLIVFDSNRSGNRDLWLMPAAGGTPVQMTTSLQVDQHSDWSPASDLIVFSAAVTAGANEDLYVIPRGGGTPTLLASDPSAADRFPSWSPDGSGIAFAKGDDIYVIPATGGTPVQVTTDPGVDTHPSWSPDGTQIAFLSNRSGNNDVWVIPAGGGTAVQVTADPANDGAPDWSPDGSTLSFQSNRTGTNEIWLVPAAGGTATRVTTLAGNNVQPDWAPNGHEIVFARDGSLWKTSFAGVDVAVSKAVDDATPSEGDTVTWTVTARNLGPDDATGVEVTDLLPAGVTYVSDAASQGAYSPGSGVWSVGALANGASSTLDVTVTVDAGTAGTIVANTAALTGVDQLDGNPYDDAGSAAIDVQSADLSVQKTVDDPAPAEGSAVVYSLTVTNLGPDPATGVQLTDLLPAGVAYVSDAPSQGTYSSGTGVWDVGALGNGAAATLDVTVTVDVGTVGTTVTNTASVSAADQTDPNAGNDSASADVVPVAAVALTQLTTSNSDQRPAWSKDYAEIVFDSNRSGNRDLWKVSSAGGAPVQMTANLFVDQDSDWSPSSERIVFSAAVAAGANEDLYTIPRSGGAPTLLDGDPANSDRFPSYSPDGSMVVYTKGTDLYVIPAAGGTPAQLTTDPALDTHASWSPDGTQIAFISNRSGNNDIWTIPAAGGTAVQVTTDPANDSAPDWSPDGTRLAIQSNRAGNNDIWIVPIGGGGDTQLTFGAFNDVQPEWAPNGNEIVFARDGALYVASLGGVDIGVAKTVDDPAPVEGATVTFTVTATNTGPDDATGVVVTDLLPAGVTYVSDVPSQGAYADGTGVWTVGALADGQAATLAVTATVDPATAGNVIVNTASVTAVNETDGDPFDDSASVAVTPVVPVPSGYSVAWDTDPVTSANETAAQFTIDAAEIGATYDYTVSSSGGGGPVIDSGTVAAASHAVSGVDLSPLGDGTLTVDVTLSNGTGTGAIASDTATKDATAPAGYSVAWDTDPVNAANETAAQFTLADGEIGATYDYTVSSDGGGAPLGGSGTVATAADVVILDVSSLADGTLTADVTLTDAVGNAGVPASDTATKATTIDLAVTKTVDDANPPEGGTIVYTVAVSNGGPDGATGVAVTDLLPAGLAFQSAAATQGVYDSGTGLWTVGAVAAGAADTLAITATVSPGGAGSTIVNTASVTAADQTDTDAGNDSASAGLTVQGTPSATIASLTDRTFFVGGVASLISPVTIRDGLTPTITAANDLRVRIPAGLFMAWDGAEASAVLSGSAASKVAAAVTYEDAGATLVLDVTADFAPSDDLTVSGLAFTAFTVVSSGSLELETGNNDVITAVDGRTMAVAAPSPASTRSTAIALTPDGQEVWVVNPDHGTVSVIGTQGGGENTLLAEIPVGAEPWTVALHPTNGEAWVALQGAHQVMIVDVASRTVTDSIPAGFETYGVAFNAAGTTALVTASGSDQIFSVDVATHAVTDLSATNTVQRSPRGIAWRADGTRAWVSHLVSREAFGLVTAVYPSSWTTAEIGLIAVAEGGRLDGIPNGLQNVTMSPAPDDSMLWAPANLQNKFGGALAGRPYDDASLQHAVVRTLNVLPADLGDLEQGTHYLSESGTAAGGPIAVDFKDGKAYVANLHSDNVTVLSADSDAPVEIASVAAGRAPIGVVTHPTLRRAYVVNWMSRDVTVIDTATDTAVATVAVTGAEPLAADLLNGKRLFYTSTGSMSSNRATACASCHLFGTADARAWDFSQFVSHVRSTPDLRGAEKTLPHNWAATMDELQDQNAKIVDLAGGAGLIPGGGNPPLGAPNAGVSQDLDDLAAYVASLRHRSSTPFPGGAAADSGEALFNDGTVGCAGCHTGPLYTDSSLLGGPPFLRHDVGTADSTDAEGAAGFDTPSLVGLWDTGPYLHDNRAETLHDVLTVRNPGDLHGTTSHLTATQIDYLVAFLNTLADTAGTPEVVPTDSPIAVGPAVTGTYFDAVFPNPFRHETSVRFSLLDDLSDVVVEVFNVEGRRVRTVLRRPLPRGIHAVGWDATNDRGQRVGAGMYFARLLVNGEKKGNKKLTILR